MKVKLFIKPIIWLGLICYGLFIPANELPHKPFTTIPHFDKMVHFGLFFVLSLLLFMPFKKMKMNHLFYAPFFSILLAALLETGQQMISSSRSSNFYDFLANTVGIFTSVVIFYFFISNKKLEKLI